MKISQVFPSKYVTASDLGGKPYTLTIKTVTLEEMVTHDNKKVSKPVVWFTSAQKGFVLNVTNARTIAALYGDSTEEWTGKRITIYPTQVRAFGQMQEALRVREEIPAQPKQASKAAQVEEPSGLDDDEDVADVDEYASIDGDVLFAPSGKGKSPDDIGPAQLLRLTRLMAQAYGDDWGQHEPKMAQDASKGSVSQFSDLKLKEAEVLIRKLEAALSKAQQQQPAANGVHA